MNINSAFPSKFLKAGDLKGIPHVVTIADVKIEAVGRDQESKPVVYFVGKSKGVVLNRVNSKKIAEIAGSQDTEDWPGTSVAIYPTTTEFGGEEVECIRVKSPRAIAGATTAPVPTLAPAAPARRAVAPPDAPENDFGGGTPIPDDSDIPFDRMESY